MKKVSRSTVRSEKVSQRVALFESLQQRTHSNSAIAPKCKQGRGTTRREQKVDGPEDAACTCTPLSSPLNERITSHSCAEDDDGDASWEFIEAEEGNMSDGTRQAPLALDTLSIVYVRLVMLQNELTRRMAVR